MKNLNYLILVLLLLFSFACEKKEAMEDPILKEFCDPYCTQYYTHSIDPSGDLIFNGNNYNDDKSIQYLDIDRDGSIDAILNFHYYYLDLTFAGTYGLSITVENTDWHVLTYNPAEYICRDSSVVIDDFGQEITCFREYL